MTFMARWTRKKNVIVSAFFNEAILRLTSKYEGYTADGIRKSYIKVDILESNAIMFGLDPKLTLLCCDAYYNNNHRMKLSM